MKFMLDAGHGLNTPGKQSPDGMKEFEFNAAVANHAKALLEGYENITVYFAHDPSGKVDIPLVTRTDRANELKVDAFVSIHANAIGKGAWEEASGIETFVYKTKPQAAYELAIKIQTNLLRASGLPNRGVKTADFHVLRESKMDSVLAECGFMTNKTDLNKLKSDSYRRAVAQAIVDALADQYKLTKKKTIVKAAEAPSPFAKDAQTWVIEQGISDGSRPHDPVTRQEVWVMLKNAMNK